MALVYATSPRGACHNQSDYFLVDVGQVEDEIGLRHFPPQGGAEKAANVARHQDWRTVFNALVMCIFTNLAPNTVVELVNTTCGLDMTLEDIMTCGERGWNLKRVINHRLGLSREDDRLPQIFLRPYEDAEEVGGEFVPDFEAMLAAYYAARGWDSNSGQPGVEKLRALGLDWTIEDLKENTK